MGEFLLARFGREIALEPCYLKGYVVVELVRGGMALSFVVYFGGSFFVCLELMGAVISRHDMT